MKDQSILKKKAVNGLFWSFFDLLSNQGIRFITQIILARLLLPEDFGVIGMITVFISLSQSIIDSGFSNALIRERKPSQKDYSTVFYFNLLASIIMYIVLFISANGISIFFNEPRLVGMLRVLGIVVIINSFGIIQRTMLTKKIDFKRQTKISFISSIISGIFAIILAYLGFGVWSLVFQNLVMQLIQSILLILMNKWKPSLVFSIKSFRKLFSFGWRILVSGLIDTLYNNLYYLIIGKAFSSNDLGYYTNAQKFRDTATQSLTSSIQKVSYPVLSDINDDEEKLKYGFKKIIRNSAFVIFPIMMGLIAVANPLINLIFGEKWSNSIVYFQVLCLSGMLFPLHSINLNILQVKGRSDLFLRLEIIKKLIGLALVVIVLLMKLGIIGLLWASVISSIISYFLNSYYSAELISYSTKEQIKDVLPSFIVAIIMGGFVIFIPNILSIITSSLVLLVIQVIVGVIIYVGISIIFKIEELNEVKRIMLNVIKH